MNKATLVERITQNKADTKESLQMLWDNINKGQQKQIIKNEEIKAMFDRYGVDYD